MGSSNKITPTSSHWGNYRVEVENDKLVAIHPYAADTNPTPIGQSLLDARDKNVRIPQPMVRQGYLDNPGSSDGSRRGKEPFIPVSWDTALDLAANALDSTRKTHGNEAIYGGSYGWASAGRFHHAQSQVHRFLNCIGGYTYSVTSYSAGAAEVIIPHVLGLPFFQVMFEAPTVADMIEHTGLAVCFGGIAMKNTQVNAGGLGAHTAQDQVEQLRDADIDFVNVSPIRDDMSQTLDATWWACRPNTDVAIMLGIAHTLESESLVDHAFIDRYCAGYEKFVPYLLGRTDGTEKTADWAAGISGIAANDIRSLARRMANERTVIGISWSLQRAEHGEQTYWMATVLAAMIGSHGLPGGGVAYGYGSVHNIGFFGRRALPFKVGALPQGKNPVRTHIPVSRISDMLLNPGAEIDYNGDTLVFPDIKVIYWAGGNPFHHHQDIARLRRAWAKPDTIIVNEPFWTATARHADIVFPCTTVLERNDFAGGIYDNYLSPMPKAVTRYEQARDDYDVFCGLAERLGVHEVFTEGRDEMQWIEHLYGITAKSAAKNGVELPDFETFWEGEQIGLGERLPDTVFRLEAFRKDPDGHALGTPSGRIEIFSDTINGFGYDDCPGHPAWLEKTEWLGAPRASDYPLHLLSNQPKTRLHSQFDHASTSRKAKIKDREIVRLHPQDAQARGIATGDVVRLYNDRGACLAAAVIDDALRQGVVELPTGAWYDPQDPNDENSLDVHGNPNVLTRDVGTSKLAQGPTAHSCLVEIEKLEGDLPPVKIFRQPEQGPQS
ncbi:MAG: molybdopterin-dependent oxidoreductase [Gammaproteobacteria bacterium]